MSSKSDFINSDNIVGTCQQLYVSDTCQKLMDMMSQCIGSSSNINLTNLDSWFISGSKKLLQHTIDFANQYFESFLKVLIPLAIGLLLLYLVLGVNRFQDHLTLEYRKDSEKLNKLAEKTRLRNMVFKTCWAGRSNKAQLVLMAVLEAVYHTFRQQVPFHREVFTYKDGGCIALDWAFEMPARAKENNGGRQRQGKRAKKGKNNGGGQSATRREEGRQNAANLEPLMGGRSGVAAVGSGEGARGGERRPILVVYPGIGSNETELYVQNAIRYAWEQGYQPVLVQYRGESGFKFANEKTIGCGLWEDAVETMVHIHDNYCRGTDRKMYAMGFSLGGNLLALALGRGCQQLKDKLVAAACVEPPLVFSCAAHNIKSTWNGFLNRRAGNRYREMVRQNLDVLAPVYKKIDVDAEKFVNEFEGVMEFEEQINWKLMKEKDCESYYKNSSGATHIMNVSVPTFVYFIEDDPIINRNCVPVEKIIQNENIMVGFNSHGAHLCSHEHFFTTEQWFFKPAFEFMGFFKSATEMGGSASAQLQPPLANSQRAINRPERSAGESSSRKSLTRCSPTELKAHFSKRNIMLSL